MAAGPPMKPSWLLRKRADHSHHQRERRRPAARRTHLRGAVERRPLDAYQRTPDQGWRLCFGRHGHHQNQAAPTQAIEGEKRRIATINDLRHSQQALERQTDELADLAEKYAEEKTRAEEANQAKSKFLANMSHRAAHAAQRHHRFLRDHRLAMFGPLGAEKYTEYSRDIRESGQYLLDVINDILDMSKIEAGSIQFSPENLELDHILADSLRVVGGRANEKRLTLNSQIAPASPLMPTAARSSRLPSISFRTP